MPHVSRRTLMTAGTGLTLAGAISLVRPAFGQQPPGTMVMADAYSYMSAEPRLTIWVQLIAAGGLEQYARAPTPYTVFPASDQAFAQFPGMVQDLLGYQNSTGTHNSQAAFPDTSKIVKLVRSHVVPGKHYPSEMMSKSVTVTTVAGTPLQVDATNPAAVKLTWTSAANGQVLSATLVEQPVTTVNAVIYIIDSVEKM